MGRTRDENRPVRVRLCGFAGGLNRQAARTLAEPAGITASAAVRAFARLPPAEQIGLCLEARRRHVGLPARDLPGSAPAGPRWHRSHRADPRALPLADRHYNRQKPGTPQFVPPGRCVVLLTATADALWVSSWPFARYVKHAWPGAWVCSCFRNESPDRASDLNRQAVAATRFVWGDPPEVPSAVGPVGMVSFIDRTAVRPVRVRGEPVWGWSWLKAGWEVIGETRAGLLALGLRSDRMAPPCPPADPIVGALTPREPATPRGEMGGRHDAG